MTPWFRSFTEDYLHEIRRCLDSGVRRRIETLVPMVRRTLDADRGRVFALGNGGSSAIARALPGAVRDHLRSHPRHGRLVQTWNGEDLVAEATRVGFEHSAAQLLNRDEAGDRDLVLLLTGSGNSRNLVTAARHCRERDVPVLAFTGRSGGRLGRMGIPGIRIDSDDQQIVEDCAHAALHLLLERTAVSLGLRADPGEAAAPGPLPADPAWMDALSTALARAAADGRTVTLIAPEGGALAVTVEHIAHNLGWDMTFGMPGSPPAIRAGVSLADYTGIVNDSGNPGAAACRLLERVTEDDVTVVFAADADHPAVAAVRRRAMMSGLALYGWYARVEQPLPYESVCTIHVEQRFVPWAAQVNGHLLMRAARAKMPRYLHAVVDLDDENSCARTAVAPLRSAPDLLEDEMPGLPADFEKLLRPRCRLLTELEPIDPDAPLWSLGVDSLEMLGMIVDLETAYQLVFPDALLVTATFDTAGSLWQAVQDLMAGEARDDAR